MPDHDTFESSEAYYKTLFHELAHSTGHESRLNRDMRGSFGSQSYSREELIAEMTAGILCSQTGIETKQTLNNTAAYLRGWIKALKDDPRMLLWAAGRAQKAADYITDSQWQPPTEDSDDSGSEKPAAKPEPKPEPTTTDEAGQPPAPVEDPKPAQDETRPAILPLNTPRRSTRIGTTSHAVMSKRKAKLTTTETLTWAAQKGHTTSNRENLRHTHIMKDGSEVSADGIRLHRAKNVHATGATCLQCEANEKYWAAYPNIDEIMKHATRPGYKITTNADDLRTAAAIAAALVKNAPEIKYTDKDGKTQTETIKGRIILQLDEDRLHVWSGSNEIGNSKTTIKAKIERDNDRLKPLELIAVDALYLIDALDHTAPRGGLVEISTAGKTAPLYIRGHANPNLDAVVMPQDITRQRLEWMKQTEPTPAPSRLPRVENVGKHTPDSRVPANKMRSAHSRNHRTSSTPAPDSYEITITTAGNRIHTQPDGDKTAEIYMMGTAAPIQPATLETVPNEALAQMALV